MHSVSRLYRYLQTAPGIISLVVATLGSLAFHVIATQVLNDNYTRSEFPVPYHVSQLSFSAEKIKGWYAVLLQKGTMGQYAWTQHVDYVFILSTLLLHVSALLLVSRLFEVGSVGCRIMVGAALLSTIAPLADALENLVSYWMIANSSNFAVGWALLYSSLATIKFAGFTFAYVLAFVGLIWGLFQAFSRRRSRPQASG